MPIHHALHRTLFGVLSFLTATLLPLQRQVQGSEFTFFRSDLGAPSLAQSLPDRLDPAANLRWRVPVDSGQSTPILCGQRIALTTFNATTKELATVALNANDGKVVWKRSVPASRIEDYHQRSGNPAPATPAWDGERLFVFFGSHGLICYDADGRTLWDHPMGPFRDEYGAGSSPVLIDNLVVLNQDHDVESFLIAINRFTGKTVWRTPRPDAVRSYSTPAIWSRSGSKQLLVAGALELAGYDPGTGEKLWWTHGLARIVIPIPVPAKDRIYMASWSPGGDAQSRISFEPWDKALEKWNRNKDAALAREEIEDPNVLDRFFRMDLDQNGQLDASEWNRHADVFKRAQNVIMAIQPSSDRGELSEGDQVWKYPRGAPYVATPLLLDQTLWIVKDGGIVTRLDAATGQRISEERAGAIGSYYASPVAGDGKVYFCSEPGVVSIVANQPDWKILSSHDLKERIHATPLIHQNRLFIRTEQALYCFQN